MDAFTTIFDIDLRNGKNKGKSIHVNLLICAALCDLLNPSTPLLQQIKYRTFAEVPYIC